MTIIASGVAFNTDPLSLLDLITVFCERTGLRVPTTVMGSTDAQIVQARALLEEEGHDLSSRGLWSGLIQETSFPTTAAEDQGSLDDLASNGFRMIVQDTIWDRSNQLPICGPMSPQEHQARLSLAATGPRYRFRIRGGKLLVNPVPTAGLTWYFEYVTEHWILDASSGDGKRYFTADTDVPTLPSSLLLLGLRWRWKAAKGLEYAELQRTYEIQVKDALARDGSKHDLEMGKPTRRTRPGVFVPEGNWDL